MTARAVASQAQIARAIRAVLKAGLRVKGVAIDGTVLVDSGGEADIKTIPLNDPQWADDE